MDKNAIFNYVEYAREELQKLIKQKAFEYGISIDRMAIEGFNSGYKSLIIGAPIIIISIVITYLLRWRLNLLSLSEDELVSQGVNVKSLRIIVIILSTVMTASVISMCGQVGWVGLIVPHLCKMKFGNNHVTLVPIVISVGAV